MVHRFEGESTMRQKKKPIFKFYQRLLLTYLTVLLIPLIFISLFGYINLRREMLSSLEQQMEIETRRKLDILDQKHEVMNQMVYDSRRSKIYTHYYRETPPGIYLDISFDLTEKQMYLPFCEAVYFYSPTDELVLGSLGKYPEDFFMENVLDIDLEGLAKHIYTETGNFATQITHGQTREEGFAIVSPIKDYGGEETDYSSALIFVVLDKQMESMVDPLWQGLSPYVTVEYMGVPVYGNQSEETQADNQASEARYTYTYQGSTGFKVYWSIPARAIHRSIMRPLLLQVAVAMSVLLVGIVVIHLLAKRNYRPINELLRQVNDRSPGAAAISHEDEINYISYAFNDMMSTHAILQDYNEELRREALLYEILNNRISSESDLYYRCLDEGIDLDRKNKSFLIFTDVLENQAIYNALEVLEDSSNTLDRVYQMNFKEGQYTYLLCSDREADEITDWIQGFLDNGAVLAKGPIVQDIKQLYAAYSGARKRFRELVGIEEDRLSYPVDTLLDLRDAIEEENTGQMKLVITELIDFAADQSSVIQSAVLIDILKLLQSPAELNTMLSGLEPISAAGLTNQVWLALDKAASRMQEAKPEGYKRRNIADMLRYIDMHYKSYDFTVKRMAIDFEMTSSNLSHFFKKSTGQRLSQYIEGLRLAEAKTLLGTPDLKVGEIGEMLGFSSTAVFIEAFKRHEGMTPGYYAQLKREGKLSSSQDKP